MYQRSVPCIKNWVTFSKLFIPLMKASKISLSLLFVMLSLASCGEQAALPGKPFEGTITQIIKVPGLAKAMAGVDSGSKGMGGNSFLSAASTANMKIYAREDKLAYELSVMGGLFKIKTIIDRGTRTITMLMPNKQAIVTDMRSMDTMRKIIDDTLNKSNQLDSLAQSIPVATGRKMEINGFEAEEFVGKMQGMDVQMWVTSDPRMQFYEIIQDAILGRQRTGMGGIEEVFAMLLPLSKGKVPVQFTAKMNGEVFASSELSKIEEGELEDAVFAIPAGYTIVKESASQMSARSSANSKIDSAAISDSIRKFITGKP